MSGYQEVFTDPSYNGQIVVMTSPMIGNYGVNAEDPESARPQVAGVVVKEMSGEVDKIPFKSVTAARSSIPNGTTAS